MKQSKVQYYVKKIPVTQKEFLKIQKVDFERGKVSRKHLIEQKIMTAGKINSLVKQGLLEPIKFKNKIYFQKEDIKDEILNPKGNMKLF